MCLERCVPDHRRRLLIVPGVKPVTVVFSVAGEDRVNAKSHWTVHRSKSRKAVVSVGRGRRQDTRQKTHCGLVAVAALYCWLTSHWLQAEGSLADACVVPTEWTASGREAGLADRDCPRWTTIPSQCRHTWRWQSTTLRPRRWTPSSFFESPDVTPGVPPGGEEAPVLHHSAAPCTSSLQFACTDSCGRNGCWSRASTHTIDRDNVRGAKTEGATDGNQIRHARQKAKHARGKKKQAAWKCNWTSDPSAASWAKRAWRLDGQKHKVWTLKWTAKQTTVGDIKLHQLQVRACIVQTTSNVGETTRIFSHLLDAEVSGRPKSWCVALGTEPIGAKGSRNICAFASGVARVPKGHKKTCLWCATTNHYTCHQNFCSFWSGQHEGQHVQSAWSRIKIHTRSPRGMKKLAHQMASARPVSSAVWLLQVAAPKDAGCRGSQITGLHRIWTVFSGGTAAIHQPAASVPSGLRLKLPSVKSLQLVDSISINLVDTRQVGSKEEKFRLRQTEVPRSELVWVTTMAQWLVRISPRRTEGSHHFWLCLTQVLWSWGWGHASWRRCVQ